MSGDEPLSKVRLRVDAKTYAARLKSSIVDRSQCRTRTEREINKPPRTIAKIPNTQTNASVALQGVIRINPAQIIDATPLNAKRHSPRISLRKRIASTIFKTPVTSAHAPTRAIRARAVIPGL